MSILDELNHNKHCAQSLLTIFKSTVNKALLLTISGQHFLHKSSNTSPEASECLLTSTGAGSNPNSHFCTQEFETSSENGDNSNLLWHIQHHRHCRRSMQGPELTEQASTLFVDSGTQV